MADNKDKKVLNVPDKRVQNDACISSAEREEQIGISIRWEKSVKQS